MKIFVEKAKLENELRLFQGIFEKKAIMEILQNIKLSAMDGGVLEMVATDLEIGLITNLQVEVKNSGSFTVNGKDLYDLVSKMPDGMIEISEDNDLQVMITNEKKTCKYKMLGLQSADYPELPTNDMSGAVSLPLADLQAMINNCYYVISPELKFNLGGALMSISKNKLEMAATDGHRLSYTFFAADTGVGEPVEYILSRKTLLEVLKIGSAGEVEFAFDNNNLFFKHKNRVLCSRIVDQKFPNYKTVIPDRTEQTAVVNTEELLQTLRRILIFKTRNNGVVFKFSKNKLVLERTTPEKGEGYDEIPIEFPGKSVSVGFNGNFILDFLTHIDAEKIAIGMNDSESSFQFKPLNGSGSHFIYIVMPLNI
ncbi:MAG TPA: DNA polymerase III subunit beta [Candidatus Aminicenantes bacterium]|nr:DNA polymerase III subunit beta [Candidatus Aminicenantes bacterium]